LETLPRQDLVAVPPKRGGDAVPVEPAGDAPKSSAALVPARLGARGSEELRLPDLESASLRRAGSPAGTCRSALRGVPIAGFLEAGRGAPRSTETLPQGGGGPIPVGRTLGAPKSSDCPIPLRRGFPGQGGTGWRRSEELRCPGPGEARRAALRRVPVAWPREARRAGLRRAPVAWPRLGWGARGSEESRVP
jgi:hypothetical protein